MIDVKDTSKWILNPGGWQFIDPKTHLIFPWYPIKAIEKLVNTDIANWDIFETGGGASTLWWASKCRSVKTIESNYDWFCKIKKKIEYLNITNVELFFVDPITSTLKTYLSPLVIQKCKFDVICVDGLYRDDVAICAENYVKDKGWILADNYQQKDVWDAKRCSEYLNKKYKVELFTQPPIDNPCEHPYVWNKLDAGYLEDLKKGHNYWKCAIWTIE